MKTTQFIVFSFLMIFFLSCHSKTNKNNKSSDAGGKEIVEQENTKDNQPQVPLHEAAFNGNIETVKVHINNKENLDSTNPDGHTPLMLASFNGHTTIVKTLLENGANVNTSDNKGLTPLHFAASGSFPEAVELLLENGAFIDATDNIENFTPLMYAASEGNTEVVKILIKHGADISLTDDDGDNALAFAKQNNHSEIVEILKNQKK